MDIDNRAELHNLILDIEYKKENNKLTIIEERSLEMLRKTIIEFNEISKTIEEINKVLNQNSEEIKKYGDNK